MLFRCTFSIESLLYKKIALADRNNNICGFIRYRDDLFDTAILKVIYPCSGYHPRPNYTIHHSAKDGSIHKDKHGK